MSNQRITCPRHHLLFELVAEGIAIKCRAGECKQVYVVTWAELDARLQPLQGHSSLLDRPLNPNLDIVIHHG